LQDHLLVMHVVGVIIHGHPDRRYFFLAYPHLAGDSNLNLECIRMALVQFAKDTGFVLRPNLYIQIDNASDNKSRFVFGALATMVLNGLVNQVELVMLPVGHTHEDIDQAFRVISEALARAGFIETLEHYIEVISTAWQGEERQYVQVVSAVHNYKDWVTGLVWETSFSSKHDVNTLAQLTTARYFQLRRRDLDGAVCLWYITALLLPSPLFPCAFSRPHCATAIVAGTNRTRCTNSYIQPKRMPCVSLCSPLTLLVKRGM
jgi:hypothetical protein